MSYQTRDRIYKLGIILFTAAAGVAVAFGVLDADAADRIVALVLSIITPILGIGVSGLAKLNVRPTVTQSVVSLEDAIAAMRPTPATSFTVSMPSGDPRAADVARLR